MSRPRMYLLRRRKVEVNQVVTIRVGSEYQAVIPEDIPGDSSSYSDYSLLLAQLNEANAKTQKLLDEMKLLKRQAAIRKPRTALHDKGCITDEKFCTYGHCTEIINLKKESENYKVELEDHKKEIEKLKQEKRALASKCQNYELEARSRETLMQERILDFAEMKQKLARSKKERIADKKLIRVLTLKKHFLSTLKEQSENSNDLLRKQNDKLTETLGRLEKERNTLLTEKEIMSSRLDAYTKALDDITNDVSDESDQRNNDDLIYGIDVDDDDDDEPDEDITYDQLMSAVSDDDDIGNEQLIPNVAAGPSNEEEKGKECDMSFNADEESEESLSSSDDSLSSSEESLYLVNVPKMRYRNIPSSDSESLDTDS